MRGSLWTAAIYGLALAATAVAPAFGFDRAAAIRRCQTDVGPRWLEPRPALDHLLLLGTIQDPRETDGKLVPRNGYRHFGGGLEAWMTQTGLRRVDVYIQPGLEPGDDMLFGPRLGEPDGIYAFERLAAPDPRCARYQRTTAARAARSPAAGPILESADCVAYRYVGALDLQPYQYVVLDYADHRALEAGYSRFVQELRRGATQPVARAVAYRLPGQPATCAAATRYLTDILQPDARP